MSLRQDPGECLVICEQCNGYLWAIASEDEPLFAKNHTLLIRCPYECQADGTMKRPPKGHQYGRS